MARGPDATDEKKKVLPFNRDDIISDIPKFRKFQSLFFGIRHPGALQGIIVCTTHSLAQITT
jgi:hypothetical protein